VPDWQEYLTTKLQFSDDNAVVTIYIWWTSDLQHILGDARLLSAILQTFFCHRLLFQLTWHVVRSLGGRFLSSCRRWNDWSGCGFFILACVCWGCLLMLYDPRTMVVWFTTDLFGDARLLSAIWCTFLRHYALFQWTRHIVQSLGDSWASFHLLIQDWLVWMWFLDAVVRLLRMFIDALFVTTICQLSKVYLVYMDSVCMLT